MLQVHTADTDHTGYKHVVQLTDDFKIVGINGSRILCPLLMLSVKTV